jgi:hypothetical protein
VIVVRHKYIPGRGKRSGGKVVSIGKALAHVKYIQHRPGPDREKGGREMFNEHDDVDARAMREAIKELGGSRVLVHKLTLAPEINPADKKAFTREVMGSLSRDMGRDLQWFAVEHNNTDHHHIHVVVLGKDRNGTDVEINLKHIDKVKEYGDRYLERWHPMELEQSRRDREDREKERRAERVREREAAREERIREGLELPWLHKKLVREQLEPYKEWKEKQEAKEKEFDRKGDDPERPYYQNTIEAAGREWSKANSLGELRDLNDYLWDNYEERIPKDEYKKLVGWIKEKERLTAQPGQDARDKKDPDEDRRRRDEFDHQGEKYSKGDSWEKLTGLASKLREGEERLPFDDYQKLRGWIEHKDRERFSGALEAELQRTHKKLYRSKTMEDLKAAEGGRVLDPLQEHLMRNPVVGLFMTEAMIANEIVSSIPLDDRNRDYLKEEIQGLEEAKRDLDEREKDRPIDELSRLLMPWDVKTQEERDREAREKIEKAKEEAERKRAEEKKRKREEKDREDDWDRFDPWGRY